MPKHAESPTATSVQRRRPQPAKQARSVETRLRILEATLTTLIESGYHRCTTTEIVRRAGVGRGAYIHHFGSHEELIRAALRHLSDLRIQELESRVTRLGRQKRIGQLVELLFRRVYGGDLFRAMCELWMAARTLPDLRLIVSEVGLEMRSRVLTLLERELLPTGSSNRNIRPRLECLIDPMIGSGFTALLRGDGFLKTHIAFWKPQLIAMATESTR